MWARAAPDSSMIEKMMDDWVFSGSMVERSHLGGETISRPWHTWFICSSARISPEEGTKPLVHTTGTE